MSHAVRFGLLICAMAVYGLVVYLVAGWLGARDFDQIALTFFAYPIGFLIFLGCLGLWELTR